MKKEFTAGMAAELKIIVENGIISGLPGGATVDAKYGGEIIDAKDVPHQKNIPLVYAEYAKKNENKLRGKVFFGQRFMPREIAEEAKRQALEIKAAMDPENRIEGLRELREAIADHKRYDKAFEKMMGDPNNDGANPPNRPDRPKSDIEALKKKYPRAEAYRMAEREGKHDHAERIANGEDHNKVIEEMKKEISNEVEESFLRGD